MRIYKIKNIYLAVALPALFMLAACSKSFLEVVPPGKIDGQEIFRDMDGLRAAVTGTYSLMADYYTNEFSLYGDMAGDHVKQKEAAGALAMASEYNFSSTPDQEALAVGHIWLDIFEAMNNVNNILTAIPALRASYPGSAQELDYIKGQALVLRALCHFDLSRVYAQTYTYSTDATHDGVPVLLKTPSPGEEVKRATMKDTYAQIIKDLTDGASLLRASSVKDAFYVSAPAAWALLSRVYLYMGKWEESISFADSVILKGGYTLTRAENYQAMFNSGTPGSEVVFQLYRRKGGSGSLSSVYNNETGASDKLMALFDAGDIRGELFQQNIIPMTTKYSAAAGTPTDRIPIDPKVARLSEVYLNRAEAQWNKKNYTAAASDAELIAQRAHPNSTVTVPTDVAALYTFICDERSRELCFEGHRLYDITRRHHDLVRGSDCNATVCTLTYPNNRFVLPIPQKELDANKGMQPNPDIN